MVKTVKTADGHCFPLLNGIMNSENVSKEMVKSFIDLANITKGLIDENQQPQQELAELFPRTRGRGRGDESRELHRVGAGESSASLQQLIQILVFKIAYHEMDDCRNMGIKNLWRLPVNLIYFSSFVFQDCHLNFSEQNKN